MVLATFYKHSTIFQQMTNCPTSFTYFCHHTVHWSHISSISLQTSNSESSVEWFRVTSVLQRLTSTIKHVTQQSVGNGIHHEYCTTKPQLACDRLKQLFYENKLFARCWAHHVADNWQLESLEFRPFDGFVAVQQTAVLESCNYLNIHAALRITRCSILLKLQHGRL